MEGVGREEGEQGPSLPWRSSSFRQAPPKPLLHPAPPAAPAPAPLHPAPPQSRPRCSSTSGPAPLLHIRPLLHLQNHLYLPPLHFKRLDAALATKLHGTPAPTKFWKKTRMTGTNLVLSASSRRPPRPRNSSSRRRHGRRCSSARQGSVAPSPSAVTLGTTTTTTGCERGVLVLYAAGSSAQLLPMRARGGTAAFSPGLASVACGRGAEVNARGLETR